MSDLSTEIHDSSNESESGIFSWFEAAYDGVAGAVAYVSDSVGSAIEGTYDAVSSVADALESGASVTISYTGEMLESACETVSSTVSIAADQLWNAATWTGTKLANIVDIGITIGDGAIGSAINLVGNTLDFVWQHPDLALIAAGVILLEIGTGGTITPILLPTLNVIGMGITGYQAVKTGSDLWEHGELGILWDQENHSEEEVTAARKSLKEDTGDLALTLTLFASAKVLAGGKSAAKVEKEIAEEFAAKPPTPVKPASELPLGGGENAAKSARTAPEVMTDMTSRGQKPVVTNPEIVAKQVPVGGNPEALGQRTLGNNDFLKEIGSEIKNLKPSIACLPEIHLINKVDIRKSIEELAQGTRDLKDFVEAQLKEPDEETEEAVRHAEAIFDSAAELHQNERLSVASLDWQRNVGAGAGRFRPCQYDYALDWQEILGTGGLSRPLKPNWQGILGTRPYVYEFAPEWQEIVGTGGLLRNSRISKV